MSYLDGIEYRRKYRGLIGIEPKVPVRDKAALSVVYTPGVAEPCRQIQADRLKSFDYTIRGNTVALVTDGSSVYGLGDVGPLAAVPMLEAKSVFLKTFAGIDAIPIAIDTRDVDEFVETIRYLSPTFGGIHLEDISAPRCFAIEEQCRRAVSLPIFHTDQQGTAVAVLAGLENALKAVGKKLKDVSVVINGAGAAGIATAHLLHRIGVGDLKVLDRNGALYYRRTEGLNWKKSEVARMTNPKDKKGDLEFMIQGVDVFIGLSAANTLTPKMVKSMAKDPIIFALALSVPEISRKDARKAGAAIVVTGLSDDPNQLNSSLVVPGIFRGALDVRATDINHEMFVGAAKALAGLIKEPTPERLLPDALDLRVSAVIAKEVARAANGSGVSQVKVDPEDVEARLMRYLYEGNSAWVGPATQTTFESLGAESLELHKRYQGVIGVKAHIPIRDRHIYNLVYSAPGAAEPCELVRDNPDEIYEISCKNNLVAVVTDGSAVLGLGNIGASAGMPVMEGKAVLFKSFGGVEAVPICLRTQEVDEIVATVKRIAPVFGGINLEDIAAPRCFEVEQRLSAELSIPVFHDDQHGTAVVTLAGLLNAAKCVGRPFEDFEVVVSGAGAAALSVSRLLLRAGVKDIIICDSQGAIHKKRKGINRYKKELAEITNLSGKSGSLAEVIKGAGVFLGLSVPGVLSQEMVKTMKPDPVIFALANPTPEILPDEARAAGARVIATGRSDFPNQVNNSLAFPGIFRGALETRAKEINEEMKLAAAYAIAGLVHEEDLKELRVIPGPFDFRVPPAVASAVAKAAMETDVARVKVDPDKVAAQLRNYLYEGQLGKVK